MIEIYKTFENGEFRELENPEKDCWICLTQPNAEEIARVYDYTNVDVDALRASLDEEEKAHIEIEDNYTLLVIDVPDYETELVKKVEKKRYITMPVAIISTKECIITVSLSDTNVLRVFKSGRLRDFYTYKKTRFILQILYRTATSFLQNLRTINRESEAIEDRMQISQKNSEIIEIHEFKKS
ncbi:MAG: magnesium transporter CorA family protein, partial [Lachnospiraceae bacterium]|nr:magnesium transporter CorA family protein [Lachnospiraceae bacterium]